MPHRTKAGAYWRLEGVAKAAARIENFQVYGVACGLEGIELAVLASVAVAHDGGRLSKGFGFGAKGVAVPTLTLGHSCMVMETLGVAADSVVIGFATPEQLTFVLEKR